MDLSGDACWGGSAGGEKEGGADCAEEGRVGNPGFSGWLSPPGYLSDQVRSRSK